MAYLKDLLVTGPSSFIEDIHGNDIYANNFIGIATKASALTNLSSNDNASSNDTWRKIWFSYSDGLTGRPALSDGLLYQTSSKKLKTGALHLTNTEAATTTTLSSQLIIGNSTNATGLELYRGSGASWQIIDESGNLNIKNNFKDNQAGSYYNDSAFVISHTTGNVIVGGGIYPRTAGSKTLGSNTAQWSGVFANYFYIKGGSTNLYNSITSNAATNIYFNINNGSSNIIPLVITNTEVRRGINENTINLGSSTYPWNNLYVKDFFTKEATETTGTYKTLMIGNNADRIGRISLYSGSKGGYIQQTTNNSENWYLHQLPAESGWLVTAGNGISTGAGNSTNPIYVDTNGVAQLITSYSGNAATATRLKEITLEQNSNNNNSTGYRLILKDKIRSSYYNKRVSFIVSSKHTGNGIITISYGCNNASLTKANCYAQIKYSGNTESGTIIQPDSYQAYLTDDYKIYFFWKYIDWNVGHITPLTQDTIPLVSRYPTDTSQTEEIPRQDFISNLGEKVLTSISADYGIKIAETSINTSDKLATPRNLQVALGSTIAVTFDGSANQNSIPVSGTLAVSHGGTGQVALGTNCVLVGNGTNDIKASSKFQIPVNDTGTITASLPINITSVPDVQSNNGATGGLIIGTTSGQNIGIDSNEIMARENSGVSTLYLNNDGGTVQIGSGGIATSGDILPLSNNSKNIGASNKKWNSIYATNFKGTADTATALQTAIIETSVVGSGLTHTNVIKNYYQSNASIPKEKLLSFYSNAYSNFGAEYLGYYIPEGTYGSFIALHYNDNPKFIGINQGNYYERTILTDDGAGNFLPAASNAYNLGSSDYQWNALYMNKFQVPSTGIIQANLPIHINGGFSADSAPGFKQSSLVIYQPNKNYPAIELCRHDTSSETSKKASWQLINENGTFKIKNNWGKVSSTATTRTENSTYTETLLSINPGTEALTNGTDPVFTAYAPIKVVHASGKQKEVEITYGSNIDFSLMVGTGNVNHGLYDSKIGSTGAWVLNTDSSHEWMFTGKKVYLAGSINANTALNSSQLVLSAVENETSGKALGIEMCYTGSDVINNSSGKQRQSWQILNDLGTLKIRTNGNGSQYESGYVETPIQIDRYSLTSITRLKPKSVEGTFYYENSNKFTIANNGSSYKKILLSKNGNNSAIFSNPPTEDGLYIISVLLLIRVPSISTNNIFYAAGLGVLPWASIYGGTYDWIDITSEGFGDSHISIKLDYRNGDTILSVETKSSSYLGGRSIEIGPKGCQIHMIKIGNHFPTADNVYPSE